MLPMVFTPAQRANTSESFGTGNTVTSRVSWRLRFFSTVLHMPQVGVLLVERLNDRLLQFRLEGFLIAFDHQHEVRFLGDDLLRRFTLAMHGIGRDDRTRQVEHVDQLLHGGISFDLSSTDLRAMHIFKPHAQADTECSADLFEALSNEPRSVLPSKATVSPLRD